MIREQRGLTLIELLIVVLIIGILATLAIPVYQNLTQMAQVASEDGVIGALATAAVIDLGKRGRFPSDETALGELVAPPVSDLNRLTGAPNVAHLVSYNPATGCISAAIGGDHPASHIHQAAC